MASGTVSGGAIEPAELQRRIDAARLAAGELRRRGVDDVLDAIERAVEAWTDEGSVWRARAEPALCAATGFSAQMIHHALPLMLAPLRAPGPAALLDAELGDRRVLDGWHRGRRAFGPGVIAHVLAGNIPGPAAVPAALSLALGSAVVVKCAAGDPVFPPLFAESIREVDELLGRCVVAADWRGGDAALESVLFGAADLVVASGSDASMAALAARVPGRFLAHGHRVSFAAVARESLADEERARALARDLAYDVSVWDQQGCLSPQICFVERGGVVSPRRFADFVGAGMAHWAEELPPRRRSLEEESAVLRFRQEAEWDPGEELLASAGSPAWSLRVAEGARFLPTCLNRCLRIAVVDELGSLPAALAPHRRHLEAAGLAAAGERAAELSETLAAAGVRRICAVGRMQAPPLSWPQGGRPRVGDWVEWSTSEEEPRCTNRQTT